MKAFGGLFLGTVMLGVALSAAVARDGRMACVDITSAGGPISHIFVSTGAAASDYAITVDGKPVEHFATDASPCEAIPNDVWFSLHGHPDTAHVCVSVQESGPADLRVSARVNNECITGRTSLVSIERVD